MAFKKLEDIDAWKRGCRLAVEVYKLTREEPIAKDWGLRDQLRRSAVSVPSNMAEGYERNSNREFRRFLYMAKGSCGELRTQLYILKALELTLSSDVDSLLKECKELSSMIQSLASYLSNLLSKS